MDAMDVGELLYEYTVKLTGMTEYGVSFEALMAGPVAGLRENVTLFTSSKAYTWVNGLQVWATGTVDLAQQVVHIKGYSA
jgi:hypothetical protein